VTYKQAACRVFARAGRLFAEERALCSEQRRKLMALLADKCN